LNSLVAQKRGLKNWWLGVKKLMAGSRWIGGSRDEKTTLVGAPDVDILAAAIEILRQRIAEGTASFLVKVKAHQGAPANEPESRHPSSGG